MGGTARQALGFGNLALRTLTEHCRRIGQAHAVIFVDITASSYNLRRRYLVPDGTELPSQGHTVCNNVLAGGSHCGVGRRRVQRHLVHTSARSLGVTVQQGVRPGDPEADLLFAVVILEALSEIQRRLDLEGLSELADGHDPPSAGVLPCS